MSRRLPRAEHVVAWTAAAVGALGVVTALAPGAATRIDLFAGVLPPGLPGAARVLGIAFGLGLVHVSRSLARRRRRAWALAVALVVGISAAHLAAGPDLGEAAGSVLLLGLLLRTRRRFDVEGDPETLRPLAVTTVALAALAALAVAVARGSRTVPDGLGDVAAALALVLGASLVHLWLRPCRLRVSQTRAERSRVAAIVGDHGRDTLSFFALRRDKSYFFSPSGRAVLAYRVVGGAALASGDPIGPAEELEPLVRAFRAHAAAHGWRVGVLAASASLLPVYRRAGLRALPLGDEAIVRPAAFSLEGRAVRKLRQSCARLVRAGYTVRFVEASAAAPALRREVERVSREWLGAWPERGFSMAGDDPFAAGTTLAVAEDGDGRLGGFLHLVPSPATGALSLSSMRRRRDTPNGLMEFLVARTIQWAGVNGAPEVSLNFCVFGEVLREPGGVPARAARLALQGLDRAFQLERLLHFNRKFLPDWRPRFLVFERVADLPAVGLASLRAESLLAPPSPRSVVRR